jgi:hypothetical protein
MSRKSRLEPLREVGAGAVGANHWLKPGTIGWFPGKVDPLTSGKRLITHWWRTPRNSGQGRCAYLLDAGLISQKEAEWTGERVWRG